jgi:hypothetical protein
MADSFIMRWPSLGTQVRCDKIGHNQHIFDWLVEQLPISSVQSHTMVSGWCLSVVTARVKTPWTWELGNEVREDMSLSPDGRIKIQGQPAGGVATFLVKYAERTENVHDMTFANVREQDLPTLCEAGAAQWKASLYTKEVIIVEFVRDEEA